jgi:DNA-binding MurR/RpiR family transcriptional regulator
MDKTKAMEQFTEWEDIFRRLNKRELSIAEYCLENESKARRMKAMKQIYEGLK